MTLLMILGITGSIGSGKTTVANIFKKYGFIAVDADKIGHQILKENSFVYKKITKSLGIKILDKNKNIDREKLGNIVFNDDKKLKRLNSIMHPSIINEIKNQIKKIKQKCGNDAKIIIDAPLLLETEAKNLVDRIIVVKCDKTKIFARSKNFSKSKIERILNSQMPLNEKLKHADFVIDNNGDFRHLENEVRRILSV